MAKRATMRRATLYLVLGIALLDTIAMLAYYCVRVAPSAQRINSG